MSAVMTSAVGMLPLGEAQNLLGAADIVPPLSEDILPGVRAQLDAAGLVLPAVLEFIRTGWQGAAALGAEQSLGTVATSLVELGESSVEIAGLTAEAAGIVARGAAEVAGIVQGYAAQATALLPSLLTPPGQIAIIGLIAEAVSQAAAVVERVHGELEAPTARMWQIAEEVNGTPVAAATVPMVGGSSGVQATPAMWSQSASTASAAPNPQAAAAVEAALSQQGVPYRWGGQSPGSGFDCSGLTQWAYHEAGVDIPRTSYEQDTGLRVSREELAPGDLVCWDGHVAMYIGGGEMVEAGDPVSVSPLRTENMGMTFRGFFRPTEQG